jgi:hypothetical protein
MWLVRWLRIYHRSSADATGTSGARLEEASTLALPLASA